MEKKKLNTFLGKESEFKNSVFLGGTCGASTWREELMSNLQFEEGNIILVDPRVDDYVYERDSVLEEVAKENCKAVIFGITNTANTASIYSFVEASWLAAKGKDVIVYCNIEEFEDGPVKKSIKNSLGFFASKGVKIVQTINELAREVMKYNDIKMLLRSFIKEDGSLVIPNNITEIPDDAFRGCSSLKSVVIPDSVTSIGGAAFWGCVRLTSVIIPNSVTSIGRYAFKGCMLLTNIKIPDGVANIGSFTFSGCSSLTNIEIPNSVTSIEDYAFDDCDSLIRVKIPNSVTSIGYNAFEGCSSLTSVEIPDSVTNIGKEAFYRCKFLIICCEAESKPDGWHGDWNSSDRPVVWNCKK